VWDDYASFRIPYRSPTWVPENGQRIRDPQLVINEGGTCIDLALFFAGLCIASRLRPYLLTDPAYQDREGHVVVAVDLAADLPGEDGHPAGSLRASLDTDGVGLVKRAELRAAEGNALAVIDCTHAAKDTNQRGPDGLRRAREAGRSFLTPRAGVPPVGGWVTGDIAVVDVGAAQQRYGRLPLPDLSLRPAISLQLPLAPPWLGYPSREALVDRVKATLADAEAPPVIVLYGAPGIGKSRIAHQVAAQADGGSGWFLTASDRSTLRRSLASVLAQESGRHLDGTDRLGREEDADNAIGRLHSSSCRWVVVLDNANCDPRALGNARPQPQRQHAQRLIVTTLPEHIAAWRRVYGDAVFLEVEPLTADDLASVEIDLGRAAAAAGGSALLVGAYRALRAEAGSDAVDERLAASSGTGASLLWKVTAPLMPADAVATARAAAFLPADAIPQGLLGDQYAVLEAHGLLTRSLARQTSERLFDLHRTIGVAIRSSDDDRRARVTTITGNDDFVRHLDLHGDQDTLGELADVLANAHETGDPIVSLGRALATMGDLFELHGLIPHKVDRPWRSAEAFHTAASERDDVAADPLLMAHCLQGRARAINQDDARNQPKLTNSAEDNVRIEAQVDAAISWILEAKALRVGNDRLLARTEAVYALLLQKKAKFQQEEKQRETLREAFVLLTKSRDLRVDLIRKERRLQGFEGDALEHDSEIARARFNLGGAANSIAAALPVDDQAGRRYYLDMSLKTYDEVGELRRTIYGDRPSQHIAACDWGKGLVRYQEAWLLSLDPTDRVDRLRDASAFVRIALDAQERLDPSDGLDVTKSLKLLAKIAELRIFLAGGKQESAISNHRALADKERDRMPVDDDQS